MRELPNRKSKNGEEFIYAYAEEHKPVTVRNLFYTATVPKIVGITKDETGYGKINELPIECVSNMRFRIGGLLTTVAQFGG